MINDKNLHMFGLNFDDFVINPSTMNPITAYRPKWSKT